MCVYKNSIDGVCTIKCAPCNNCKTSLNIDVTRGVKWRSPDRWNKYKNPIDNLMYAVLIRAVMDAKGYTDFTSHNHVSGNDAIAWLECTGRAYLDHLDKYGEKVEHYEEKKTIDRYTKEHQ